jgi:hypothetical protein
MKKTLILTIFILLFISLFHTKSFAEDTDMKATSGDNQYPAARISTIAAGTIIAGESVLLLAGMNYPSVSSWSTKRNIFFASSDIILGSVLVVMSIINRHFNESPLFYVSSIVLLSTHGFREFEYLNQNENAFCANRALFIMNNVRIGLIGGSLTLAVRISF